MEAIYRILDQLDYVIRGRGRPRKTLGKTGKKMTLI